MKTSKKKNTIFRFWSLILLLMANSILLPQSYLLVKYKSAQTFDKANPTLQKTFLKNSLNDEVLYNKIKAIKPFYLKSNRAFKNIFKIEVSDSNYLQNLQFALSTDNQFDYVGIPAIFKIDAVPNDSLYNQQWGAHKIGAPSVWNETTGDSKIIISVIDTGIDYLHPDLQGQFYVNEIEDLNHNGILDAPDLNGLDDDGNGFIDDVIGWDFTDRTGFPFSDGNSDYLNWDNDPMDENSHGTNIAGIIGAAMNNNIGISGIAPGCRIMNLRAFDPSGFGEEDDVASAILYAVDNGANVINMSFGDDSFSYVLRDVIEYAYEKGVVFIGSSGNSSSDLPHYPSSYPQVISVGASTEDDFIAPFSNTGSTIDIVAPGLGIVTTDRSAKYAFISGTSASAPFVSAAAGLLLSKKNFNNNEIKQILKTTAEDIGAPGWDLKSGAGRLNLSRAMEFSVPSVIKINSPIQDFSTSGENIDISATVMSPYFQSYELEYGEGYNPSNWTSLVSGKYQISNEQIYSLKLPDNIDTVYTIRLNVNLLNGNNLEERINIHFDKTPPVISLINLNQALFGEKSTIFASVYTDDQCTMNMFYRKKGETEYKAITLDGFASNNKFVKQLHWGFIPKSIAENAQIYEIYFSAENLSELTTILKNNAKDFEIETGGDFQIIPSKKLEYSLPAGRLFKDPVNIQKNNFSEIIINESSNSKYADIYKLENNLLVKTDSLFGRIPKSFGDFNSNGKKDLLSLFVRNGFIDEQINQGSTAFENFFADTSGEFWPILAEDIDNDGKFEILSIKNETFIEIWEVNSDLTISLEAEFDNYTDDGNWGNSFEAPNAAIADIDNDGKNEIWLVDFDGDILSFIIDGPDSYSEGYYLKTGFLGETNTLSTGDYNGDGKEELAVLLRSLSEIDIAPFNLLLVFNFRNDEFNFLEQKAFVDPSSEFNSSFQQTESSLRFADIDNDSQDELSVFAFPYAYLLKFDNFQNKSVIINYLENVNSSQVFVGDLNSNGVKEIAYPTESGINFFEYGAQIQSSTPYIQQAYNLDSAKIYLNLSAEEKKYIIYRGETEDKLLQIDSVYSSSYVDSNIENSKNYFYAVKEFDNKYQQNYSNLSQPKFVFNHKPAQLDTIFFSTSKNIIVLFSGKMQNKIDDLASFKINSIIPNSVSPLNEYAYLINFAAPFEAGKYNVSIEKMTDFYSSPVPNFSGEIIKDPQTEQTEFFISSYSLNDPYNLSINFNLKIDPSTIKLENFSFSPENKIKSLQASDDEKSISISSAKPIGSIGIEYILSIDNLYSAVETGNIKINSGAGSFIVISTFANNLDQMYVYPQPVSISNSDKITFANITKNIEIVILSLTGERIREIAAKGESGGIQWDLKDESGNFVGSGIYIYRAVSLDENGNEKNIKLGKIAVVK